MNRKDEPGIVSLEAHRRKRLADSRRRAARPRSSHERAINWRRAPLFLAVVAVFILVSWLLRYAGGLINPFH